MKTFTLRTLFVLLALFAARGDELRAQLRFPSLRARPGLGLSMPSFGAMAVQSSSDSNAASIFPNINVTNDPFNDQNEPSLSVDPLDPLAIAIGEVDDRSYDVLWYCTTKNGGLTWDNDSLPHGFFDNGTQQFYEATDPGVVFDQTGTLFFSNVLLQDPGPNEEACYRSTDIGQSWQSPVYVGGDTNQLDASQVDRDYITVDRDSLSIFFGRVYIVWVSIAYPYSTIVESHSTDHGSSWSLPVQVSPDTGLFQGPVPACGPNGELYITYEDRDSTSRKILVAHSLDGGVSFTPQVEVSAYRDLGPELPDNFDGHPAIKDSVETNSFPSIAVNCELSREIVLANRRGWIYVTWCGRDADSNAHVFLSISKDSGMTWTPPGFIDEDSSSVKTDKFLPWIAVDQSNGNVGVTFYDSRNDPDSNILVDDYLTLSTDGGETFTARRITNTSFDPRIHRDVVYGNLYFFGDYICLDALDSVWYPAWTDTRSGFDQDIYMSVVRPYAPMPVTNLAVHDTTVNGKIATVLTWKYSPETTFGYPLPSGYQFDVAKDGSQLALQNGDTLSFLDTNAVQSQDYEVTVQSGSLHSITDSVQNVKSGVSEQTPQYSSIRFVNEPASVGRKDALFIDCGEACSVALTFYDELGRIIGSPIGDGSISSGHELHFTPSLAGVEFFKVKETSSSGVVQVVGKLSIVEP